MSEEIKDVQFAVRLTEIDKRNLIDRCKEFDREPSAVVREMILAFNSGKLTITVGKKHPNFMTGVHRVPRS